MPFRRLRSLFVLAIFCTAASSLRAETPLSSDAPLPASQLYARDNLWAWCIVPFDAKRRGPEERAAMLEKLGLKHLAYDYRAEHIPTFDEEVAALKRYGVSLDAWWFPTELNDEARLILDVCRRHDIHPQLWITGGGAPTQTLAEQQERVRAEAARIRPIAEAAAPLGCQVGLYNHGAWFGEPENQIAIIRELGLPNVGIVYNLHHGHAHLDRLPDLLELMRPYLLAVNLNGMTRDGDQRGLKIMPLATGDLDLQLLEIIRASGYRGPIGILNHTEEDAEGRLQDNLAGLDWLVPQLEGQPAGPRPVYRTYRSQLDAFETAEGFLAEGRESYRQLPLTIECRATLRSKQGFNILLACDTKSSAAHWELFTLPGSGHLTAYMPGATPDHLHSEVDVCDGQPHNLVLVLEAGHTKLLVDGRVVAEGGAARKAESSAPQGLALGRLLEGKFGCEGTIDWARISRGLVAPRTTAEAPPLDDETVALWKRDTKDAERMLDLASPANHAQRAMIVATPTSHLMPTIGSHVTPSNPKLKSTLIDRSPDQVYMALRCDSAGRLFVGGREGVFVFEPNGQGGFLPRQELYRFPHDSIIIGLELRGDDLYVMTSAALYVLPEGRVRREGLQPRRLLWGLPLDLHVSFHCLAFGPQGDLYLDHGDPLLGYGDWKRPDAWGHWTLYPRPGGTKVPYNGAGAVWRLKPDGTDLRYVAGGLRGPVGLAFDPHWNLFTNDNDHESQADRYAPARLLHVTPEIDFAWPRGWMASKSPERADLVEPMLDSLGRGVPCDMAWYDEPRLSAALRQRLLLCRWESFDVTAYETLPRGASFAAQGSPLLHTDENARPTGIAVGPDGRIFVSSSYLAGNVASPYCVSEISVIDLAESSFASADVYYDETKLPPAALWEELASLSWFHRHTAHQEILRRGGELLVEAATRLSDAHADDRSLEHLIWLAAAGKGSGAEPALRAIASDARHPQRSAALRALAEFSPNLETYECFVAALENGAPAQQLAALDGLFPADYPLPLNLVARLAGSADDYLRQTAARLLSQRAELDELQSFVQASDPAQRLAGTLAAGMRLTVPARDGVPPESLPLFYKEENTFFKTKLPFADAAEPVDLRALGRLGSYTTAEAWHATPHTPLQEALFALLRAALEDETPRVQAQAAYYLSLLRDERVEPLIEVARREALTKEVATRPVQQIDKLWAVGPFDDDAEATAAHPPETQSIDLSANYDLGHNTMTWREESTQEHQFAWAMSSQAPSSTYAHFRLQSGTRQPAVLKVATSAPHLRVWFNGSLVHDGPVPEPSPAVVIVDAQPGSNDVLIRLMDDGTRPTCEFSASVQARDEISVAHADRLDASVLAERLRSAASSSGETIPAEFATIDWSPEVSQGDAERGRALFGTLGCTKCHAVSNTQAGGGAPSLADAKRRFTIPHLVESVLLPSRQIAAPFRGTTIATTAGEVLSGLVVGEAGEQVTLLLPDGTRRAISVSEIDQREPAALSPMPSGLIKTPGELRDLLRYLLLDQPTPP
ncbi:MAG: c-type cytochrome [Pirellulales bacterium]|nr:c-type cytochrome [Pirellulales bacterium]